MTMKENYKILAKYIKDMSSETKDVETYLYAKENILFILLRSKTVTTSTKYLN